ncbi:hypothetical protein [Bacillus cereus]|uniref:hypothetical protein n=1 Tax=Bacillus cereus TaxID=1396 RepID=UPI000BF7884E|nr:hypothetical protein [Bacillus cereus]PFO83580.1 hypothetical protein COJ77_08295 [Bacillus cereus]
MKELEENDSSIQQACKEVGPEWEKYQDEQIKKHEAEQKQKEEEFHKAAAAHRDRWEKRMPEEQGTRTI